MNAGIIYYTDNKLDEPIYSVVQQLLDAVELPIVSASLKPINFGLNEVVEGKRGYPTLVKQIVSCLERSTSTYVFFCEHDVLYDPSHFTFTPPKDDIFYYNSNVWRWLYGSDTAVRYDRMLPLSVMCCNRELALNHFKARQEAMEAQGLEQSSHEPRWSRIWGYEPGTKKTRRGGFSNEDYDTWQSEIPCIDIRHPKTYSPPKVTLDSFKHAPVNWQEIPVEDIPGWNLKEEFIWI